MASSSRIDSLKKQYADNQKRYFAALANEYRKAGDLAQSIALCRQHLPEQPNHISGHIVFGQALFEAGELAESRAVFETALSLDPENLIALRHLGDIASQAGDPTAAREWYTRILHADPRNEEIQGLLRTLPEAPASAVVEESAPETPEELSGWAADLASEDAAPLAAPAAPPVTTKIVEAYTPPAPPQFDVRLATGEQGLVGDPEIPLPPPPVEPPAAPASAGHEPFDLDFGAGNEMGLGVHLSAEPPRPPSPTPPIAMEAIFEASRENLHVEPPADIRRTGSHAVFGDDPAPDAADAAFDAAEDHATEPIGGRNISEEMEAIFGAPDGNADVTAMGRDEMGVEDMEFRAPERDAIDDETYAAEEAHAAAAGAAAGITPQAFVTETMAELYLQQGFREEALNVYRQLLAQNPHDRSLRDRVHHLEAGARSSVSITEVPELQDEQAAPPAPDETPDAREAYDTPESYDPPAAADLYESADAYDAPVAYGAPVAADAYGALDTADAYDAPAAPEIPEAYEDLQAPAAFAPAEPPAPSGPRTARDFFGALAMRRAPVLESMAEVGEYGYDGASAADGDQLAADLAGPAHTTEPIAFEGSTTTGLLGHHGPTVSEGDVAAGAPVAATPETDDPASDAVYHPALEDAAPARRSRNSVPEMLAAAFDGDGDEPARGETAAATLEVPFVEGSLDRLFGGRDVPNEDQQAATSLASAFTGEHEHSPPPAGRPTRPAEAELSLDRVFRTPQRAGTPIATKPVQPGGGTPSRGSAAFSFDQFFADSGSGAESPAAPSADPGEVAASDIEQFNSWLEGLKKK